MLNVSTIGMFIIGLYSVLADQSVFSFVLGAVLYVILYWLFNQVDLFTTEVPITNEWRDYIYDHSTFSQREIDTLIAKAEEVPSMEFTVKVDRFKKRRT